MNISMNQGKLIINALKNGSVPKTAFGEFLIGREDEVEEFHRILDNLKIGAGTVKFILGDYGSGKSLLVHAFKKIALDQDYIVSMMQIDRVFRLNKLDDLYYYIMHHLYVKNSRGIATFDDIFEIWIDNLKNAPDKMQSTQEINKVIKTIQKYNDTFARALLNYIRHKIKNNEKMVRAISSWLSGEKNIPYELKKEFHVIGKVDKQSVFDFLKAFSKLAELLGYNGLVVIIDELDLVLNERSDIRGNAYENLKHLMDLTVSGELVNTLFMFSGDGVILKDEDKGLMTNEALRQRLGESVKSYDDGFKNLRQSIIYLKSINQKNYVELTEKIIRIYEISQSTSFGLDADGIKNWVLYTYHKEEKDIEEIKTREFITRLIKILDTIDQNPENHIYKTTLELTYSDNKPIFKNVLRKNNRT